MSLTQRLKKSAGKEYLASDGSTYILQKVNGMDAFISQGVMLDIVDNAADIKAASAGGDFNAYIQQLRAKDPQRAERLLIAGMNSKNATLQAGLVGEIEYTGDGGSRRIIYRHTDKPLELLEDGEINVAFIDDTLKDELADAITSIGKPALEGADVKSFPEK